MARPQCRFHSWTNKSNPNPGLLNPLISLTSDAFLYQDLFHKNHRSKLMMPPLRRFNSIVPASACALIKLPRELQDIITKLCTPNSHLALATTYAQLIHVSMDSLYHSICIKDILSIDLFVRLLGRSWRKKICEKTHSFKALLPWQPLSDGEELNSRYCEPYEGAATSSYSVFDRRLQHDRTRASVLHAKYIRFHFDYMQELPLFYLMS